ncbi:HesA/MoeB/ThiF family protein [Marinicellulosiphila megalodicopiae]|uniref:HesA/MoeB/ThiF family protein n=1 Tax=Marinicellulosiphila megalodicopiae TaxID=2724896 RepID=UPI003BB0DD93
MKIKTELTDDQWLRYSRHLLLPQFDQSHQLRLKNATVFVYGAGGLGSPLLLYLAASGVGNIIVNDFDDVELSNLQRQIIHKNESIGVNKSISAKQSMLDLNDDIHVENIDNKLNEAQLKQAIQYCDLVFVGTDNFDSRYLINKVCVQLKKPQISAAALGFEGQLFVMDPNNDHSACYRCLYPNAGQQEITCSDAGVFSPVVGVLGTMQVLSGLKFLTKIGDSQISKLQLFDALSGQWRIINVTRRKDCPECSS